MSGEPDHVRSFARGGLATTAGFLFSAAFQFLLVVVVTRGLATGAAGAFLEAVALFVIVSNVAVLGADVGLVRVLPTWSSAAVGALARTLVVAALAPVLVVSGVAAVVLEVFARDAANLLFDASHVDTAVTYIRILAPALPLAALEIVALAGTRGFGTMFPYVAVDSVGLPVVRVALVATAVLAGLGTAEVAIAWAAPLVVGSVIALLALAALIRAAAKEGAAAETGSAHQEVRHFWHFALPRGLASMMGVTVAWLDVLLVGALRSTREAGIYAAASRLALVGSYALQAVGTAIAPQFSGLLARRNLRAVGDLYQVGANWVILLTWPLYFSFVFFAPVFMKIFGGDYAAGQTALLILALAVLVDLGTGNVNVLLLMAGRSRWHLFNSTLALVLNVGLNILLIPRYGISGAAVAWAASIVTTNIAAVVEVTLLLRVRLFPRSYLTLAASAALLYGGLAAVTRLGVGGSPSAVVLFAVLVSIGVVLVLRFFRADLQLSLLRRAFRP